MTTAKRSTKDRVQGIDSRLAALTLRDGTKLAVEIGASILPTPSLKRTMEGSSSISLEVYDPELKFLQASMLAEKFDAEIDDLHFRYVGTSKSGRNLTITLEDRAIALLREARGPDKVLAHRGKKNEVTRAEYTKTLVKKAAPHLTFVCPQLHDKQPIAHQDKAKKANEDAKDRREKGIGAAKHLTIDGAPASPAQKELGEEALRIADSYNAPQIVEVAVIAALMDESNMGEASPGNVLQALEPYTKVRPAAQEISGFIAGEPTWTGVTAIGYAKSHPEATFYEICQAVQKSGAGESTNGAGNYGKFGDEARAWVEAFGGEGGEVGSETVKEPRTFEVKKGEDYWTAIKRMAKEVNWRAFVVGERFYFIDELELARGMVRLAIDRDTPGIPPANVDFNCNANKKVTEVKLNKVPVKQWKPPPGSVVTLEGYGPASLGFGDAPVKANAKGQKAALSSNRNAKTGEGRGRYLVASIEVPLTERLDARLATITLKKPTAPLPEPATETKTVSKGSAVGGSNNPTVERVLAFLEKESKRNPPYVWGGFSESGYDCSGFVSKALNVGGWLTGRTDTKGLAGWGEAGPGELVTVYVKTGTGSAHTEHTIIEVDGRFFQSGGGENDSASGGADEFSPSPSYLAEFNVKRHPKGF